jgi:OCT family organic cation transporter-like MFS transporter 18
MSTSLWWLFLSRIAVFGQQAVLASRTFIAVLSNSDTRLLSYINLFYGLGTMLGPALAGVLINQMGSLRVGALFAVLMSLINTGLTLTLLKDPGRNESGPDKVKQRRRSMTEQIRWAMFPGDFSKIQRNRALRWILCVRIPSSIASSLFHAIVSLMLVDRYSLKAAESGWIFSFIGVVVVIAQVLFNVFINHFKYSEKSLLFWASSIMPIGFLVRRTKIIFNV